MLSLSVHVENHRTVCMIVFLFPYSYNWNQSQLRLIPIRTKIDPNQELELKEWYVSVFVILLLDDVLLTIRRIH